MNKSNKKAKKDNNDTTSVQMSGADTDREADEDEGGGVTDFIYMGFPSRTFDAFPMLGMWLAGVLEWI